MQEAHVYGWARDSHVSAQMLESVRELNHRFLDLIGLPAADWTPSRRIGPSELCGQVVPLSAVQKRAAANCPYALFDLRFDDDAYWRTRLQNQACRGVADDSAECRPTLNFVRVALFFAWHVASAGNVAAQLLLGMNEATVAAFRLATIDCVSALATAEPVHLTARWSHRPLYWNALTQAALRPNSAALRRIQLCGLQLAAAARLS